MSRRIPASLSSPLDPSSDICPVCKSNRYLNPSLTFLINGECYHTMCTSCVDRLFTSGPAPCPVAGCHKTLRKKGFHKAFFADLSIEREVDVRKRVGAVFNRRQDEFESLLDWNNYLEMVEDIVFDIVEGGPKEKNAAEEKLRLYKEGNRREIEENLAAEKEYVDTERSMRALEAEKARLRRERAAREEKEERQELERNRRDILDRLARGEDGGAEAITREAKKLRLERKKAGEEEEREEEERGLTIRGLKKRLAPVVEKPYDAFGGLDLTGMRFVVRNDYQNEWLDSAKVDTRHMVGGYSLPEYYERTMFEAFSGLGVFIEDEVTGDARNMSPVSIAAASMRKEVNDVF